MKKVCNRCGDLLEENRYYCEKCEKELENIVRQIEKKGKNETAEHHKS